MTVPTLSASQKCGQIGNKPTLNGHDEVRHDRDRDGHGRSTSPGIRHEDAIDADQDAPGRQKLLADGSHRGGVVPTGEFGHSCGQHQGHLHDDRPKHHKFDGPQLGEREGQAAAENHKATEHHHEDHPSQPPKCGDAADQITREGGGENDHDDEGCGGQPIAQQGGRFIGEVRTIAGHKADVSPRNIQRALAIGGRRGVRIKNQGWLNRVHALTA